MAVDASIPLQAYQPTQGFDPSRAVALAGAITEYQQRSQDMQRQNALRQLLAQPGAVDPATGSPTPNTLAKVMAIDPDRGMKLQQNALTMMSERTQLQNAQIKRHGIIQEMIDPVRDSALNAYDEVLKKGGSQDEANAAGQKALDDGLAPIRNGGQLSDAEKQQLRTKFDYLPMKSAALSYKERAQLEEKKVSDERQDRALSERNRHDAALENLAQGRDDNKIDSKWQVLTDPEHKDEKGNTVPERQYRYNPATAKATTLTGEPYTPWGASKMAGANQNAMSDDATDLIADQVLAGNRMAVTGLARSAANIKKVNEAIARKAKEQGLSGADIAAKQAEFSGMVAGERTLGTRSANMEVSANEVKYMAPLALAASAKVERTQYPNLNSIILSAEKGTGNEDVVRFGLAANSLIYMYAKFLNPNGIPTDADKAKATDILSTAWAKGQFSTAVDQIQQEIKAGQSGISQTKKDLGGSITKPIGDDTPKPGASKVIKYDAQGNRLQ